MNRKADIAAAEAIFAEHLFRVRPGDLLIDCGANVGKISRQMAQTGADVLAFEPDPVVFEELTAAVGGLPNVTLRQCAVGTEEGEVALLRSPYYDENPLAEAEKNTICAEAVTRRREGGWQAMDMENSVSVPLVDLPVLLEDLLEDRGRIAVLKLDIEGMEVPILQEMDRRGLFDRIGLTIAELHPWRFPEDAESIRAMRDTFATRFPLNKVNLNWG